jgi:hypothetical protein
MPYERALVLASGRLPKRMQLDGGEAVLAYKGIPEWLAEQLCRLLNLEMTSNV